MARALTAYRLVAEPAPVIGTVPESQWCGGAISGGRGAAAPRLDGGPGPGPSEKENEMRRTVASLAVVLCALTMTSACGGDGGGNGGSASGGSSQQSEAPKTIAVTINGNEVTPNGDRIEVDAGQDVELDVTADKAGEIHVHSTPEQELEYKQGKSTLTITNLDQPGTVDVEVHDLEKVIVQLEVH
jgi:hypothetical protein